MGVAKITKGFETETMNPSFDREKFEREMRELADIPVLDGEMMSLLDAIEQKEQESNQSEEKE